jgi:hypothetical protein
MHSHSLVNAIIGPDSFGFKKPHGPRNALYDHVLIDLLKLNRTHEEINLFSKG